MVGTFLLVLLGALFLVKLDKLSIFSVDSSGVGFVGDHANVCERRDQE